MFYLLSWAPLCTRGLSIWLSHTIAEFIPPSLPPLLWLQLVVDTVLCCSTAISPRSWTFLPFLENIFQIPLHLFFSDTRHVPRNPISPLMSCHNRSTSCNIFKALSVLDFQFYRKNSPESLEKKTLHIFQTVGLNEMTSQSLLIGTSLLELNSAPDSFGVISQHFSLKFCGEA